MAALVYLIIAFAMLWLPLGQHDFLYAHWMKVGTFMAPCLLFVAAARRGEGHTRDLVTLSLWMWVAYIVHQFEEHWVDVLGNVYAFHGSVNGLLQGALETTKVPLSPAGIFVINTSLVWLVAAIAVWRSPKHVFPALAMAAIIVVNAFSHLAVALMSWSYNPGVLTSVVVFVPIGAFVYREVLDKDLAGKREIVASIVWAVLAHVVMVGGLVAGGVFELFPETVYFAALIVWSALPAFLFRTRQRA